MQDQPERVGIGALVGRPIGGRLALMHLDQIFGMRAGAVSALAERLGPVLERGDDEARFEPAGGSLECGSHALVRREIRLYRLVATPVV